MIVVVVDVVIVVVVVVVREWLSDVEVSVTIHPSQFCGSPNISSQPMVVWVDCQRVNVCL